MENSQHQQSLWGLIKEYVLDAELPEVRTMLGEGLIDMYMEIYSEVQMWEQIWQNVQDGRPQISRNSLADPPAMKDLLRAELQLLLLTLRAKAASLGRDQDEVMSRYNHKVVIYALGGRKGSPQCGTVAPPSMPESSLSCCESRSSSRVSSRSSSEDEIEALRHKLNVTHIDEVVSHLKSFLSDECEALKRDVQFLQESVELEYQKHRELELVEPTLTELKEERRIIQRDLHVQSLLSEASDKPCPVPSRFTGLLTSDSDMDKLPNSLFPSRMSFYPSPSPPDISRPVHLGKSRHKASLKVIQPLPSFLAGGQLQELDPDPSCRSLSHWTSTENHLQLVSSTASSMTAWSCSSEPRKQEHEASRWSPVVGPDLWHLCEPNDAGASILSKQPGLRVKAAGTIALLPTPPAVQKAATRVQHGNRRLTLPQTGSLLSSS